MDSGLLIAFIPTFAAVLALPGPNAAFAVGQSLKYGIRKSFAVAAGFMLATGAHAVIVLSGLGLLIESYTGVLEIIKWCGVAYLVYLAKKLFFSKQGVVVVASQAMTTRKMMLSAMLVSLTNPKALLASLMIYPLFMAKSEGYVRQAVALVVIAMFVSFVIYAAYIVTASKLGRQLNRGEWASKTVAGFYLGAAGLLASK